MQMAAREQRRPTFFWQGMLILLPVIVLAVAGLFSLRQDKLLAEQEARESGQIFAQRLAQVISTEAVQQLRDYYNAISEFDASRTTDLGLSAIGPAVPIQKTPRGSSSKNGSKRIPELICPQCRLPIAESASGKNFVRRRKFIRQRRSRRIGYVN